MGETVNNYPDRIYEAFYDKTIFLTGATGFVGKVILERFLRMFDIKRIYVLVRNKKEKDVETRMKAMFANPLFDKVRSLKGDEIFGKCKIIPGDITLQDLGIAADDREILKKEVDYIYHSAANVRFDETLKSSVLQNVKALQDMVKLAKEMDKLKIFVHVSTAYSHPEEKVLYEKIYHTSSKPEQVIQMMEWLNDDQIEKMSSAFLDGVPNTYTFTKALAEDLLAKEMDNLPIVIVRPSIVTSMWKEPLPGWTDNINGPTGLMIGAGKGVVRSMYGKRDVSGDFFSVDGVADVIFCVTAYYINDGKSRRIFNMCTSNEIRMTWGEITDIGEEICKTKIPFDKFLWCPGGAIRSSRIIHQLAIVFYQLLPALLVDALIFCFGYKPFLWRVQKRIAKGMEVLEYYTSNEWTFSYENIQHLRSWLNSREKSTYIVTVNDINVREYFENCVLGARRYLLNEPDENLPRARKIMRVIVCLDRICNILKKILLGYLFYRLLMLLYQPFIDLF